MGAGPKFLRNFSYQEKCDFSALCKYSIPCSLNHVVVLTHAANAMMDRSGNLQSGLTIETTLRSFLARQ